MKNNIKVNFTQIHSNFNSFIIGMSKSNLPESVYKNFNCKASLNGNVLTVKSPSGITDEYVISFEINEDFAIVLSEKNFSNYYPHIENIVKLKVLSTIKRINNN